MTKLHYQLQLQSGLTKEFKKLVYRVYANPDLVIVHYVGDSTVAIDFPHGNSNKPANFLPAAKSLTITMGDKATSLCSLQAATLEEPEQFQPRNNNQKRYFERKSELNADSFMVLHELAYVIPQFIWQITTYPDLTVFFGLPQFFSLLDSCYSILLSYDTTFQLGDFYVTTLVIQNGLFEERPIFPIAFMLHERKFQKLHEDFCTCLSKMLPSACQGQPINICTDGESACSNAIQKAFPHWNLVSCWNHILLDVEYWLKKHDGGKNDISLYKTHVRDILQSKTHEELCMTTTSHQATWSQAFADHYRTYIEPKVKTSCQYKLLQSGIESDGVTTNNSESMNAVIKRFQDFKEVPVDKVVYAMFRLQVAYGMRINKSLRGFGPYIAVSEHQLTTLQLPECQEYDDMLVTLGEVAFSRSIPDTVEEVARSLVVVHVPQQQIFSVSNAAGVVHCVKLFPKESCTCPVGTICCHILAAKYSIGMTGNPERRINLAQLRRNSRKRNDKKSGRKTPRKGDITFTEAADSAMAESQYVAELSTPVVGNKDAVQSPATCSDADAFLNTPKSGGKTKKHVRFGNLEEPLEEPTIPKTPVSTKSSKHSALRKIKFDVQSADSQHNVVQSPAPLTDGDCVTSTPTTTKARRQKNEAEFHEHNTDDGANLKSVINSHDYMNAEDWQALKDSLLTDNVINAAQLLMKNTTNDQGLQDTVLVAANAVKLATTDNFVQIVHDSALAHWLVATNYGCRPFTVRLYCSMTMKPSESCLQSILRFINAPRSQSRLQFELMNVAKQAGAQDCGLFAVAYTQRLISGMDPTTVVFDQDLMREHLRSCLSVGKLEPFPPTSNRVTRRKVLRQFECKIYCICRGGCLMRETMIACDTCHEWFHKACINMSDDVFSSYRTDKSKKYLCDMCKTK